MAIEGNGARYIMPTMEDIVNAFTERKINESRGLYIAMCKGKIPQRGIHRRRNGKPVDPIMGQGFAYHGAHVDLVSNS